MTASLRLAIVFLLSRRCNLRCHYCNVDAGPHQRGNFDPRDLERWVDSVGEVGDVALAVQMHGGEPLLHDPSIELLAAVVRNSAAQWSSGRIDGVGAVTNGTLLDRRRAQRLIAADIDLNVSIDGPPHLHDRNRVNGAGRGSHHAAMRGVEVLRKCGAEPRIISVVSEPDDVLDAFEYFRSEGLRAFKINPVRPEGRAADDGHAMLPTVVGVGPMVEAYVELARRIARHNRVHTERWIVEENVHSMMSRALGVPSRSPTWTLLVDERNRAWAHPGGWGVDHMRLGSGSIPNGEQLAAMLGVAEGEDAGHGASAPSMTRPARLAARQRSTMRPCAGCADPFWCTLFRPLVDGPRIDGLDAACAWRERVTEALGDFWERAPDEAQWIVRPLVSTAAFDR